MGKKNIYTILLILDGLGKGEKNLSNPFRLVKENIFEELKKEYPFCYLNASGMSVGLPANEPGNCEQGHLALGTGVIHYTPKLRIDLALEKGELINNKTIKKIVDYYYEKNSRIHMLFSLNKTPTEADINHIIEILKILKKYQIEDIYFHLFLDSTYSPPRSGYQLLENFSNLLKENDLPGKIGTICGRFYALDTTKNYALKTQRSFLLLTKGIGKKIDDVFEFLKEKIKDQNFKEDLLEPIVVNEEGIIKDNDIVLFLNFEPQNIKQLAEAFLDPNFKEFERPSKENLLVITLNRYFETLPNPTIFEEEKIKINFSRIFSDLGFRQFKITDETRKKHITFYFNGLIDEEHINETIKILPAIENEESAFKITEEIFNFLKLIIKDKSFHLIVANLSILDFFGHLGEFKKAIQAIEFLSSKLKELINLVLDNDWFLIITSDHGNIEKLIDLSKGTRDTFHNFSPVPFYLIHKKFKKEQNLFSEDIKGDLIDVLPTILDLYGVYDNYKNYLQGKSLLRLI
ncbi:MAG: hypothetical protein C4348_01315 [Patescibacteria group bacterium]